MALPINQYDCGDLVYIPSEVTLVKYDRNRNVKDYHVLSEPLNLLVTDTKLVDKLGVYYKGGTWYLKQEDVYRMTSDQ